MKKKLSYYSIILILSILLLFFYNEIYCFILGLYEGFTE